MPVIAIDTCTFVNDCFPFGTHKYEILLKLAAEGHVTVLITDVVANEVKKNIRESVATAFGALSKAKSEARILKNLPSRFQHLFELPDQTLIESELIKQFSDFLNSKGIEIVDCSKVGVSAVLDAYFNVEPPFENKKDKKAEFPDAISLSALTNWARKNGQPNIVLVTSDKGWMAFTEKKQENKLSIVPTIQAAIEDTIRKVGNAEYVLRVERLVESNLGELSSEITDHVKRHFGFTLVDQEGEVLDVEDLKLDAISFSVIDFDPSQSTAVVSLTGTLSFKAEIQYDNTDNATWDSEDKRLIVWDQVHTKIDTEQDVEAEFTLRLDEDDQSVEVEDFKIERPKDTIDVFASSECY